MYYSVTQKEGEYRGKNNVILSTVRTNLKVTISYKQTFESFPNS